MVILTAVVILTTPVVKASKVVKLLSGLCVCLFESSTRVQNKNLALKRIILSKKRSNNFYLYDQDRLVIMNLPICVKLLYKVCGQRHHNCLLPLWRVHEIKRTYLASRIHGLYTYNLNTILY